MDSFSSLLLRSLMWFTQQTQEGWSSPPPQLQLHLEGSKAVRKCELISWSRIPNPSPEWHTLVVIPSSDSTLLNNSRNMKVEQTLHQHPHLYIYWRRRPNQGHCEILKKYSVQLVHCGSRMLISSLSCFKGQIAILTEFVIDNKIKVAWLRNPGGILIQCNSTVALIWW